MIKPAIINVRIQAKGKLSQLCLEQGIEDLQGVVDHLRSLPYGRTSEKRNLALVMEEGRGTCSAKHAFLAQLAFENGVRGLHLALCTYNITESTHHEAKAILKHYGLKAIPEARCFIRYKNNIYNLVGRQLPKQPEIMSDIEIAPIQVASFKKRYHKNYIENWLRIERIHKRWSPEQIWSIREECIEAAEENWESCPRLLCCA